MVATPDILSATVSWTAPSGNGGAALSGYTVQSTPGNFSCTATAPDTQCVVENLASVSSYTFTVTATNSGSKTSDSSTASSAVSTTRISGEVTSNACTMPAGACAYDGSDNWYTRSLNYSTGTGIFSGTITTNQCANFDYGKVASTRVGDQHNAACITQTFPAPDYAGGVKGVPLRGRVAMSVVGGVNVYSPLDGGISTGQACDNALGSCAAGVDVQLCKLQLQKQCGSDHVLNGKLIDDCSGHGNPYHLHGDLSCEYNTAASGHSPLVAIALDGHGVYGINETTGTTPPDLDACGGHFGPVPSTNGYPAASNVYHYHTRTTPPYTLGCFGPVANKAACMALYPNTCGKGLVTVCTIHGEMSTYDTDCPCNIPQTYTPTVACPAI